MKPYNNPWQPGTGYIWRQRQQQMQAMVWKKEQEKQEALRTQLQVKRDLLQISLNLIGVEVKYNSLGRPSQVGDLEVKYNAGKPN
jgi:hypothetical protein